MLVILPFINVVLLILLWYGASFALVGWLVTRRRRSLTPDAHLRVAIREVMSQLLLEMAEQGDDLTILGLMERCPPAWHTGKGWALWVEESHAMAMQGAIDAPSEGRSPLLGR